MQPDDRARDVADGGPRDGARLAHPGEAGGGARGPHERAVAGGDEPRGLVGDVLAFDRGDRQRGGVRGAGSVAGTADRREQQAVVAREERVGVAAGLVCGDLRHAQLEQRRPGGGEHQVAHLRIVTVVPAPSADSISNSSISRRAPGSPSPSRSEVE